MKTAHGPILRGKLPETIYRPISQQKNGCLAGSGQREVNMIKRILSVTAALCMLYGSTMLPAADAGGVAVRQIKITGFDEAHIIKPIPVKEEENGENSNGGTYGKIGQDDGGLYNGGYAEDDSEAGTQETDTEIPGSGSGSAPGAGSGSAEDRSGTDEYQPDETGDAGGYSGGAESDVGEPDEDSDESVTAEGSPEAEPAMEYLGDWTITAYCGCSECCGSWGNATASGRPPISGHTVASNILPFYTRVMIGDQVYEVEDTGYTEYGDEWLDIYFDTHEEALAWGVKVLPVYIVR